MAVGGGWPLVGRAEELAFVVRGADGKRQALLLSGAAGVGKSRFAAEVLATAAAEGWATVALAAGVESASVPFSPFLPLLGEAPASDTLDRFLAATRALEARGDRVVVSIDDAHLLDDVSIAFVRHLLVATEVRLVLTARSGERMPGALADMWTSGLVERIDLQPLSAMDVEALASAVLDGPIAATLGRWLWETSHGNPLYVRELLLDALDRGGLVPRESGWQLTATERPSGDRLRELVAARVGSVDDEDRVALELLAIAQPLGATTLVHIVGDAVLDRLETRGLVVTSRDRRRTEVRLAHPLHGEVLREQLGARAAIERRRQLIDAIAATGARRAGDDLRLALWRCDVGDTEDWRALLTAAHELTSSFERPLAAYWTGNKDAVPVPITGHSHLETSLRLAQAAFDASRSVEAAARVFAYLQVLDRHEEAAEIDALVDSLAVDDEDRFRVLQMRVDSTFWHGGQVQPVLDALVEFEERVDDDRLRASARSRRAQLLSYAGRDLDLALELANDAATHPDGSRHDRIVGVSGVAMALSELGRSREGLVVLDELLATVTPDDDTIVLGLLMTMRVIVLAQLKRLDEALALATVAHEIATSSGNDAGIGVFAATLSSIEVQRGHPKQAVRWALDACRRLGGHDLLTARRSALISLATAQALLGDVPEAEATLDAIATSTSGASFNDDEAVRAHAWVDIAAGRTTAGLARLQAGAEGAQQAGRLTREQMILHDLVRLGHAHVVVDRLRELASVVDCDLSPTILRHAEAFVAGDAAGLEASATDYAAAGAALWAAEAWSQLATLHERDGKRSSAAAATARAQELLVECEGAMTPALALGGPVDNLSAREREIAGLARRGLTDKEIAAELVLSVRTVQSHLYNVYGKLGIEGRADLPSVLPR